MKAADSIKTPAQYLASLPEPRRSELRAMHAVIRKAAPALKPSISYGGLGYGQYHYRYASGREGDAPVIGLASQKQHISLYMCGCDGDTPLSQKWGPKLGKVSIGVGCIRFKKLANIDLDVLADIARKAAKWAAART